MLIHQVFLVLFALSIPLTALAVTGRLAWCAFQSLRGARFRFAALSGLAVVTLAGVVIFVAFVWFGYGMAHSKKDIRTDIRVVLITGLPFYGVSVGFWRLTRYIERAVRTDAGQSPAAGR